MSFSTSASSQTILDYDVFTLAEKLRNHEITSVQATQTYIDHLKEINPLINCIVAERFTEALHEAKLADEKLQKGTNQGRLFGVPISIKECFNIIGMDTTGGLPHLQGKPKNTDAKTVSLLKSEGAIILGKTNTPTLCFCQETNNKLYGQTNTPWDPSKTVGGSSGGEAALIATGGAAVGIGSDIGGSIRFPSHFNGVVGFKSGNSQISYEGGFPEVVIPLQQRMLGVGAMAKSVRDARLIHEIISQSQPEQKQLQDFEVVLPLNSILYPINEKTRTVLTEIKQFIHQQFTTKDEQPPFYEDSALLWQQIMSIDGGKGIAQVAFNQETRSAIIEYAKEKLFKKSQWHHYLTWALIGSKLFQPNDRKIKELEETILLGDQEVQEYLSNRMLILPVYHTSALKHGKVYQELFSIRKSFLTYIPFVAYANVWGLPVLVVPVGEDSNGLPIGVQIISSPGNEDTIFQLGTLLEKQFRGYKRCKMQKLL